MKKFFVLGAALAALALPALADVNVDEILIAFVGFSQS